MRPAKKNEEKEPDEYLGAKLSAVDVGKLKPYLLSVGASAVKNLSDPKDLLTAYATHVKALSAAGKGLMKCDTCGSVSEESLAECPVCGSLDEQDPNSHDLARSPGALEEEGKSISPPMVATPKGTGDASPLEIVEANDAYVVGTREGDLDRALATIRQAKNGVAQNVWRIGCEALAIKEQKLYLERKDAAGKPLYKNWDQFCDAEIGLSGRHVENMILLSTTCSEADFLKIGVAKMNVIARLQSGDREVLIEAAKKNSSLREIVDRAKIFKLPSSRTVGGGGTASRREPTVQPSSPAPNARGNGAPGSKSVTVVFQLGKNEIKLDRNGKGNMVGREELLNAVTIDYEFNPKTGVLKISRSRED